MNIALVCDDLTQFGGHERVILEVSKIFPNAPLYTTMATDEWLNRCRINNIELHTSYMQMFPFKKTLNRFYAPFLFHIFALESFNFDNYDLVISISSRFAHGIITKPQTLHICYMSTVGRMIWEPDIYFENDTFSKNNYLNKLKRVFLAAPLLVLKVWDKVASSRVDYFISNSETTRKRINKYYKREAEVIYPSIQLKEFQQATEAVNEEYYVVITRFAAWKKSRNCY